MKVIQSALLYNKIECYNKGAQRSPSLSVNDYTLLRHSGNRSLKALLLGQLLDHLLNMRRSCGFTVDSQPCRRKSKENVRTLPKLDEEPVQKDKENTFSSDNHCYRRNRHRVTSLYLFLRNIREFARIRKSRFVAKIDFFARIISIFFGR